MRATYCTQCSYSVIEALSGRDKVWQREQRTAKRRYDCSTSAGNVFTVSSERPPRRAAPPPTHAATANANAMASATLVVTRTLRDPIGDQRALLVVEERR